MRQETIAIILEGIDRASNDIRNVSRQLDSLGKQGTQTGGIMGKLQSSLGAAGLALGAKMSADAIGAMITELNSLGAVATQTQNVFEALSGEIKSSSKLLDNLRKATKGTVTDTALMQGANQLMRMGLAENSAEVERLIDLAVKLKQPTDTASEAVDNFALMLANQSVERLDSFGISSAKVRQEIERLIETGQALSREEAFKMAVLELGAEAVENLGSAVEENATELSKLQTRWQNFLDVIGQDVNTNIEITAKFINDVSDWAQTDEAQQQQAAFFTGGLFAGGYGGGTMGANPMYGEQARNDIAEAQRLEALRQIQINQLYGSQYTRAITEADKAFLDSIVSMQELREQAENVAKSVAEAVGLGFASLAPDFMSDPYLTANLETVNQELEFYMQQLTELEQTGLNVTGIKSEVEELTSIWGGVTNAVYDSITAIERLQNMKLDDLLGRAGDSQQIGLVEMILGNIESDELRDTISSEFALLTGQETQLGQVVENEISQQIARVSQTLGTEVGFAMVESVQNALQSGAFLGLDEDEVIELVRTASEMSLLKNTPTSMLGGGSLLSSLYTVQPNDSPWSILASMGYNPSQIAGGMAFDFQNRYGALVPGQQINLGAEGQGLYDSSDLGMIMRGVSEESEGLLIEDLVSDEALAEVEKLESDFENISQKVRDIYSQIKLTFRDVTMQATIKVNIETDGNNPIINEILARNNGSLLGRSPTNIGGSAPSRPID